MHARKLGLPVEPKVSWRSGAVDAYIMVHANVSSAEYSPAAEDLYILSGRSNPAFLATKRISKTVPISIPASDWIHDFAPKLGLGEYFIVEIPKGEEIIKEGRGELQGVEL